MSESRREFFKRFIPDLKKDDLEKSEGPSDLETSRRNFLKILGFLAVSLQVASQKAEGAHVNKKDNEENSIERYIDETAKNYSAIANAEASKLETFVETALVSIGRNIAQEFFHHLGFENIETFENFRREWGEKEADRKCAEAFSAVVFAPVIEESFFRLFPSEILAGRKSGDLRGKRWDIGIPTAVIFGLLHNFQKEEGEIKLVGFEKNIPLSALTGGIFLWYLQREKGFGHAVLGHFTNNAGMIAMAEIFNRAFPHKKDESVPVS